MAINLLYILSLLYVLPLCSAAPLTPQRGTNWRHSSPDGTGQGNTGSAIIITVDKISIAPSAFPTVAPENLPEVKEGSRRASIPHEGIHI
jgi:hypothetical protein